MTVASDSCLSVQEFAHGYIQHTLTEDESRKVEEHLCTCHQCRQCINGLLELPEQKATAPLPAIAGKDDPAFDRFTYIIIGIAAIITLGVVLIAIIQ